MTLEEQYKRLKFNPGSQTTGTVISVADNSGSSYLEALRNIEIKQATIPAAFPEAELPLRLLRKAPRLYPDSIRPLRPLLPPCPRR